MATTATPPLSFAEALNSSTKKIFQFQGRARRSEYWWTMLVVYLASLILPPIGSLLSIATIPLTFRRLHDTGRSGWWWGVGMLIPIAFTITFIYDVVMISTESYIYSYYDDFSIFSIITKYIVWILVMLIYSIILLIFLCMDSEKGENKYGESPKYVESDTSEELNA